MSLINACVRILQQLTDLIAQLDNALLTKPSKALSNASIGKHLRHTLEFFICFEAGYNYGIVNYDKREHDKSVEEDKMKALQALEKIEQFIYQVDFNKPLQLEFSYGHEVDIKDVIATTAKRELLYNIEHAVHHMAIMKIGIRELAPHIVLPPDFGVASSTLRFNIDHAVSAVN